MLLSATSSVSFSACACCRASLDIDNEIDSSWPRMVKREAVASTEDCNFESRQLKTVKDLQEGGRGYPRGRKENVTASIRASFTTHLLALKQQTQHILLYTRIYFDDANPEDN